MQRQSAQNALSKATKKRVSEARVGAQHLAVNCRSQLDNLERLDKWETCPDVLFWHELFSEARDLLMKRPKPTGAPPNFLDQACGFVDDSELVGGNRKSGARGRGSKRTVFPQEENRLDWSDVIGDR